MKRFKTLLLALFMAAPAMAQSITAQQVVEGRSNSPEQMEKPYVIMVSADGFRYDYAEKYRAKHLKAFAAEGVQAESMVPSFPSKTFPNHYTLVTGMYPVSHGLVGNSFYDPKRNDTFYINDRKKVTDASWYGGVPLWVLAEQQQLLSASFYWVGSEAPILDTYPTYWYRYNEDVKFKKRVQAVVDWLQLPEEKRPHLITFYMPEVDHAGHTFGPESPETSSEVRRLDKRMKQLTDAVAKTGLPVNYIFVSDHGMTQIDQQSTILLPPFINENDFKIVSGGTMTELHATNAAAILPLYQKLKSNPSQYYDAYLKDEMPAHLNYSGKQDRYNRVGDIVLVAKAPKLFASSSGRMPAPGNHGFDPIAVKDMHATFIAWGPNFKEGLKVGTFSNVQVYAIVAKLLGLPYSHQIDGDDTVAEQVLKAE
ncbi:ectonucleotide pyrophosphatase/phosphodiesterase [uncultured Pontibacter sp.]|uniref:alkaline phosphatase family protein n=1 Tax=uncultured Pontibacter sp. TaxID=453356 RepID=UPI00261AD511|nr:ectonucleotide pyrophosphatase/phosphodiesterase [uncultured Pontibacter sp.]